MVLFISTSGHTVWQTKNSSYLVVVLIGGLGCAEPDSKLDLDEDGSVGRQEDLLIASDQLLEMPEKY